jgi:NitT/TauT family transport system ATP-binding protein
MSNIQFHEVGKVFERDGKPLSIIEGFDFTVQDQEFVAIVGPSGCGKTTCMRMAAGLEFPSSGSVTVSGRVPAVCAFSVEIGLRQYRFWFAR